MNRKYIYPLLFVAATVIIYFADDFVNEQVRQPDIESGKIAKPTANNFFLPTSTTGEIVYHNYYTLSYSEKDEQAEWVAYELKQDELSDNNFDRPYFEIDNAVPTKAANWRNYKNSGYDRGHLCPAGDRRFDKQAYLETFLTSNITPQLHDFNSGVWNRLEQQVRRWAKEYDGVYVVTGGILNNALGSIGDEDVTVPAQFYKIILDRQGDNYKVLAFLMPHKKSTEALNSFVTTVDNIEELTGIDFFPKLDDELETKLEASKSYSTWNF
tara:strand:+ start:47330 stop:48136 length:807 start_codon:yes stop_codon:yes gene_type:complete